jgi:hypothetical protein
MLQMLLLGKSQSLVYLQLGLTQPEANFTKSNTSFCKEAQSRLNYFQFIAIQEDFKF